MGKRINLDIVYRPNRRPAGGPAPVAPGQKKSPAPKKPKPAPRVKTKAAVAKQVKPLSPPETPDQAAAATPVPPIFCPVLADAQQAGLTGDGVALTSTAHPKAKRGSKKPSLDVSPDSVTTIPVSEMPRQMLEKLYTEAMKHLDRFRAGKAKAQKRWKAKQKKKGKRK